MLACSALPIRISNPAFAQDEPSTSSSTAQASYPNSNKHASYYNALSQWLNRSEKDDAVYAQAYSSFKPFEDEYDALSASVSSLDSSDDNGSNSDSSASPSSPPNASVSALGVQHTAGLSSTSDLQTAPFSVSRKPDPQSSPGLAFTLPTAVPLYETHPPRLDGHGRLQPFEETQVEKNDREEFVKQREYVRRLSLGGSDTDSESTLSSEWEALHTPVVPTATNEHESDGRAKEDLEDLITSNSPYRRRHRPSRQRERAITPAQRQQAALTIQRAYRTHLERAAALSTIVDEIEGVAYDVRDAFLGEIARSETKLPTPTTLLLYNTALTTLSLRLSLLLSTLPAHITSHPSITSERMFIEDMLKSERVRAENLGVQMRVSAMRRKLWKGMERGEMLEVLEEGEEDE